MRVGQKLKLIDLDASVSFANKEEHSGMKYSSAYVPPELLYVTLNKVSVRCPARTHSGVGIRGGERDDMSIQTPNLGRDSSITEYAGVSVLSEGRERGRSGSGGGERGIGGGIREREGSWGGGIGMGMGTDCDEREEKDVEYSEIYGPEKRDRTVRNLVETYDSILRRHNGHPGEYVRGEYVRAGDSFCSAISEVQFQERNLTQGSVQGTDVQVVRDSVWQEDGTRDVGRFSPNRYLYSM
jgi:hypothetical protein